jgi:hypothetical protein
MDTAQRHNDYAGSAAGDASPKEPRQQDEPEVDTAMSLTTHTAKGHHNDNGSTGRGSLVPHQPASSFNLQINSFAPLTAIGSLFTPIRSLPTLLAHALPFWKKGEQPHAQQQLQEVGQEQAVPNPVVINEEEQLGSRSDASVVFLYECRSDAVNPPTTTAAESTPLPHPSPSPPQPPPPPSPPQPKRKRKRRADQPQAQAQNQAARTQGLSDLERVRARKRAKRAQREDTVDFQLQLEVRVPVGLRQATGGGRRRALLGGKTRGLRGGVWEEFGEEHDEEEV